MNAKMPELQRAFEAAGFADVKTVLGSGNVVFDAPRATEASLAKRAERAMQKRLGHSFPVIVRRVDVLASMLEKDPFRAFRLRKGAKRVVTFLKRPPKAKLALPVELHGARILRLQKLEVFTEYVPSPRGAVFMVLIEKTFGKEVTTRTWDTVKKVAKR
jgi:uncharacterized protein (DUF1697 family)